MTMNITCPCCGAQSATDSLLDALTGTSSPALANTHIELVQLLCDKGPMTVEQLTVFKREHIGSREGEITARYIRRMLTDVNKRIVDDNVLIAAESSVRGASTSNPMLVILMHPESPWASLTGAAPHMAVRAQMAAALVAEQAASDDAPAATERVAVDLAVGDAPDEFASILDASPVEDGA